MSLPSGYTQLEYIESTGTQYIDTGIKPNQNTCLIAEVSFLGSVGENVLGVRTNSSDKTNRFGIITYSRSSKFGCFYGTSGIEGSSIDTNSHVFEISSLGFFIDGINYGNPGSQIFSCSYPITIGAWNDGSSGITCTSEIIKSVEIYNAGTLVRNYIPAIRDSDSYIGMYDTVNKVFYTNSGSGTFKAGSKVGLNGYTRLKYIKATGSQYINTRFKPNQDTTVEFSVLDAKANQYYFGAWNVAYNDDAFAYCNDQSDVYIGYDGQGGGTGSVIKGNHVIKLEKNIAYLDDTIFSSYDYEEFQVNYPLFLFGQNRAGTFFSNADGGICCEYCKIYDNGTLVRHFVPAMRNSDSTIGMYDTVNDVFYINAGTEDFLTDPAVLLRLYTQLNYIKSTGTQYINTGFSPNQDTKIVADMAYLGGGESYIFGTSGPNNYYYTNRFGLSINSNRFFIFYWHINTIQGPNQDQNRHLFVLYKSTLVVDETSYGSSSTSTFSISNPITISAYNSYNGVICSSCKIYAFKIYDNGILVRDLIPVKRNSDGEIGLYDLVSGKFFKNSGTGTFIAGYKSPGSNNFTLINGVSHRITSGKGLLDSTVYDIKHGRTMIDGTIFQIPIWTTYMITIDGYMQSSSEYVQIENTKITKIGAYTIESSGELELTVCAASRKTDDGTTYASYIYLNNVNVAPSSTMSGHDKISYTYILKNIDEKNINISFDWNNVNLYYTVRITTSN